MSREQLALALVWVAAGIVIGFTAWYMVSPYLPASVTGASTSTA